MKHVFNINLRVLCLVLVLDFFLFVFLPMDIQLLKHLLKKPSGTEFLLHFCQESPGH